MGLPRPKRRDIAFAPSGGNVDPFFDSVVLLLRGDDFTDTSSKNKTVNNQGTNGVTIDNTLFKYGSGSLKFPATNGYLSFGDDADFKFGNTFAGAVDFTIEGWINKVDYNNDGLWGCTTAENVSTGTFTSYLANSGQVSLRSGGNTRLSDAVPTANEWHHYAIVHRSGTVTQFIDGVTGSNTTLSLVFDDFFVLGVYFSQGFCANANYDSFRVTRGIGRYTADFDPETETFLSY